MRAAAPLRVRPRHVCVIRAHAHPQSSISAARSSWQHLQGRGRRAATRCRCRPDGDEQPAGPQQQQQKQQQEEDQGGSGRSGRQPAPEEPPPRHPEVDDEAAASALPAPRSPEQLQLERLRLQALKVEALEQYQRLMEAHPPGAPDGPPVLEAALLIARHAHPDLDAAAASRRLDELAAEVDAALAGGGRYPLRVLKELRRVLYERHGFRGNAEDYYDPANSCINRVLETKKGIPISLSVVLMEVASRLKPPLPLVGVNLPAHFFVRPDVPDFEFLVDPFTGELSALEDAEELLGRLMGSAVKLDPRFVRGGGGGGAGGGPAEFGSRQLLLRLLNNLRQIYMQLNMAEDALAIVRYMRMTTPPGVLPELLRDEGLCLFGLGRLPEAAEVLREYLRQGPPQAEAAVADAVLERIRERARAAAGTGGGAEDEQAGASSGGGGSESESGDSGGAGQGAGGGGG